MPVCFSRTISFSGTVSRTSETNAFCPCSGSRRSPLFISQWGYDFRPSYLRIAEIRENFRQIPVLALTATATPRVAEDIQQQLKFEVPHVLSKSFRRDNIAYVVRKANDKLGELLHILSSLKASAIVYVRKRAERKSWPVF